MKAMRNDLIYEVLVENCNYLTFPGADKIIRMWHPLIFTRPTGKSTVILQKLNEMKVNEMKV